MKKNLAALSTFIAISTALNAGELMLNTRSGDSYYINIEAEDSFQDVMATLELIEEGQIEFLSNDIHMSIDFSGGVIEAKVKPNASGQRNYYEEVGKEDAENIHYLLNTLAYQSLIKITSKKSSLTKAGDQADTLHPLRFLLYIFSHDELIVCIRNIRERSLLWKEFSSRLLNNLKLEFASNNITYDQLKDVAGKLNIAPELFDASFIAQDANALVEVFFKNIERQGDPKRFDM